MRHYKKDPEEKKEKESLLEEFEHDVWDLKKIFIGIVLIFILFGGGAYFLKTMNLFPDVSYIFSTKIPHQGVAGVATKQGENAASASGSLQSLSPQVKLEQLKQEVNNLNVQDMAANSPQVKKLQKDFQDLSNVPKDQAKAACMRVCNGL